MTHVAQPGVDNAENGDDEEMGDEERTVNASVEEFITMVAAGLTSNTPHMISASTNALSRLVFEFHGECCVPQRYSTVTDYIPQTRSPRLPSLNSSGPPRSSWSPRTARLSSLPWASSSS